MYNHLSAFNPRFENVDDIHHKRDRNIAKAIEKKKDKFNRKMHKRLARDKKNKTFLSF